MHRNGGTAVKKRYLALTLLLIVALLLPPCAGCAKKQKKYTDQAFEWFDSYYSLTVYTDSQEKFDGYGKLSSRSPGIT